MNNSLVAIKEKFVKAIEHLKQELNQLRTGRANPALVERLEVEAYGTKSPLIELASITVPEVRQIVIQPWDPNIVKEVEKAITNSNLGVTPTIDGKLLRVNIPSLNEERRKELIKIMTGMLEQARVQIRNIREDFNRNLKKQEKEGEISEDELFASQKELQKQVDQFNEEIKNLGEAKEKEIMTI
ncbi:MAG: ribosome recycling factor [Patescibacteria group bacterium]